MVKKISSFLLPEYLKSFLRERNPYFKLSQTLQAENDACVAQLAEKDRIITVATENYRKHLAEKDQEIVRITEDCKKQAETLRAENDACIAQLAEKDRTITAATENYRKHLAEKDQEIVRITEDCKKQAEAFQAENNSYVAQLAEKDSTITVATENYRKHLAEKEQEIVRITEDFKKREEDLIQKLANSAGEYRYSLQQQLARPSIREEHLCLICGSPMQFSFSKKIMNKYDAAYFSCENCGHLQTERPYWLYEAYASALSDSDVGQIWRNERNRDIVCAVAGRFLAPSPKVLEYGGGYGLLTRMLRDSGMECRWSDKYADNVFARYFEDDGKSGYDLVLAFEVLEHFENPMQEFEKIFARGQSLLFSEVLLPELCPNQWWYLCTEHGQHINFYALKTLQYVADRFGKKLYFHGDVGLMTSIEINQEEFAETLDHVEVYAKAFRESNPSLTASDMDTVIKQMEQK